MTLTRSFAALVTATFLLPLLVFAQTDDALRTKIRADIMSDPRSSEMAPSEVDAMVEALAGQAEEEGTAADYLRQGNSFSAATEPPVYMGEETPSSSYDPLMVALLSLLVVLVGVVVFLMMHRKSKVVLPLNRM